MIGLMKEMKWKDELFKDDSHFPRCGCSSLLVGAEQQNKGEDNEFNLESEDSEMRCQTSPWPNPVGSWMCACGPQLRVICAGDTLGWWQHGVR